jgi:hypothetical protein
MYLRMKHILAAFILAPFTAVAGCGLNTDESITFDNPFCYDYDFTFSVLSSSTISSQTVDVDNVIRDDYVLREISITDADKDEIYSIEFLAPDGTVFSYPGVGSSTARVSEETLTPTEMIYSASNIKTEISVETVGGSEIPSGDPVLHCENHLGTWELTIKYLNSGLSSDVRDAGVLHKTYEVCFLFDE